MTTPLTSVVMQIICNYIDLIIKMMSLACGMCSYHVIDSVSVVQHWPKTFIHQLVNHMYTRMSDPFQDQQLSCARITSNPESLTYLDVRKIVHLHTTLHIEDSSNTVEALSWAKTQGLIDQSQLDDFLRFWRCTH